MREAIKEVCIMVPLDLYDQTDENNRT